MCVFPATSAFRKDLVRVGRTIGVVLFARADAPRTPWLFVRSGARNPLLSTVRTLRTFCTLRSDFAFAASRFFVRRGVPALPISRERGGLVHRRCAGARLASSSPFTEADRLPAAQQLLTRRYDLDLPAALDEVVDDEHGDKRITARVRSHGRMVGAGEGSVSRPSRGL